MTTTDILQSNAHSIQICDVSKSFGAVSVMRNVSIDIHPGEFVVLVGPSGCGKSTLLRMLAGLEEVTDGQMFIGDRDITDLQPKLRDIAMVFQNYALYPQMTVAQNIGFSLKIARKSQAEIDAKVRESAGILGLDDLLGRYPRQLSGGQRQRVAMGRAILRNPSAFLFDEPLSNLDAKLRVQMRAEIKDLHRRLGCTTVYVTHDQIEAMTMADRIVVMRNGNIEQTGAPLDLYDEPANMFVAGFLGSPAMNMLPAHVADGTLTSDDGQALHTPLSHSLQSDQQYTYGIRPEHFAKAEAESEGAIKLRVHLVEPTGAETVLGCKLGKVSLTVVFRDRVHANIGDEIWVRPNPDRAHVFADSGARISE